MNKRGAMAIMIIIALILLFLVIFFITIRSLSAPKIKQDQYSGYSAPEVEEYIKRCAQQSLITGIKMIGQQGGSIFRTQGGTTPNEPTKTFDYNGTKIWMGIRVGDDEPMKSCNPNHPPAVYSPWFCPSFAYPFERTTGAGISFDATSYPEIGKDRRGWVRLFNKFTLPRLYPENKMFEDMVSTYKYAERGKGTFIHTDLKSFMEHDIGDCTTKMMGAFDNLDMDFQQLGGKNVTLVIGDSSVDATLHYPIRVSYHNKTVFEMSDFFVSTNIRLKKVYEFLWESLKKEATDFSYDLGSQTPPEGMTLNLSPIDGKHYLVRLEDSHSFVPDGLSFKPFVFQTVVEKSQPALSYIHFDDLDAVPGLHQNIINCPQYSNDRDNPFEETGNNLSVEIGTTMSRRGIECIWKAYEMSLPGTKWAPWYEPDMDLVSWEFKTAGCDWNESCTYKGDNLYFKGNYLAIRITDGVYNDSLNMSLSLHDHPPEIIWSQQLPIEDLLDKYLSGLVADIGGALSDLAGFKAYIFIAKDEDIYWGEDVDNLSITVTPKPLKVWEQKGDVDDQKGWGVLWKHAGGFDATFAVQDKYGEEDTSEVWVT